MTRVRTVLALLLALPALRASVITVDASGAGDFTTLTAAVAAAVDGDVLLVEPGNYVEAAAVVVNGKALTIVGETTGGAFGAQATLSPGLQVRNLPPGKHVVLENLVLQGLPSTPSAAPTSGLVLRDNTSHVRVQSCVILGGYGASNNYPGGAAAADIANCYSTAFLGCYVRGGAGQFSPTLSVPTGDGGPAIINGGSNPLGFYQVLVSECGLKGGNGGSDIPGGFGQGGTGGAGILQGIGSLLVTGSSPRGGDGGVAFHGGDGGPGLVLVGGGRAWLLGGSGANGGSGGSSNAGPNGVDGLPIVDPAGLVNDYGGTAHNFNVTSPVREGQMGQLVLGGDAGDTTLLFASLAMHQLPFTGYQGVLLLAPNALIGPFILSPPGWMPVPFLAPDLPPGLEVLLVHLQPAYSGADGVNLGTGRVLTILDAGL